MNISGNPFEGFESREDFIKFKQQCESTTIVIEEQKEFIWTRVYLNDEDDTLREGDTVYIKYNISGEILETTFGAYNKKNTLVDIDNDGVVTNYVTEDDRKCICLAVDINFINKLDNGIPYLRQLFKQSKFFTNELIRISEIDIYTDSKKFEYYSIDF